MCSNLVRKSNRPVYAYDLCSAPVQRIAAEGGVACDSVIEIAQNAEIVFLSLPSIVQVEQICMGPNGLVEAKGKVRFIIDTSTSDVARTRELAKRLKEHDIVLIDAPVARMRKGAVEGTLLFMVGGEPDDYREIEPYFLCMGTDIAPCGGIGNGQVVKILNNMVMIMTVHALAEAITIGRNAGVDGSLLFNAFGLGSANSFVLNNQGRTALVPDKFPEGIFPTDYAIKDIELALELARNGEINAHAAALTHSLLEQTRDAGFATDYYPIMVKLIEQGYKSAN